MLNKTTPISARAAARRLGLSPSQVARLATRGLIKGRRLPGYRSTWLLDPNDVERLARIRELP